MTRKPTEKNFDATAGSRLESAIRSSGKSVREIAEAAGVDNTTIYKWFKGQAPDAFGLRAVAIEIGVSLDSILLGDPGKNNLPEPHDPTPGVEKDSTERIKGQKAVRENVLDTDHSPLVQMREGGLSMDIGSVIEYMMDDMKRLKDKVEFQGQQMTVLKEEILQDMHSVVKNAVEEAMEGKKH